jgi:5-methyltetrahydrofolate--homocysteine methyltransferase
MQKKISWEKHNMPINDFDALIQAIYEGDMDEALRLTQDALDNGEKAEAILNQGLIKGMDRVGVDFKNGDLFLPEVLLAARAMKSGLALIQPILIEIGSDIVGSIALGTVEGDIHDIGKNLVGMMLEGAGFKVIDLGTNVSSQEFIRVVEDGQCQIIGMSAMLTTTMMMMKTTIDLLKERGLFDNVKIMVGGAPITAEFAGKIGAYYSPNASEAVDLAKELIKK